MIDWQSRAFPFTGFGDDPDTAIKFMLVRHPQAPAHAWTASGARISSHIIHNSNDEVTQYHGRGPTLLTTRLWLQDMPAVEALLAVVGRSATLRYRWGLTTNPGGTKETRAGRSYVVLPDTLLASVDDVQVLRGRQPEVTATFRRPYGSGDLYGFAIASEG